MKKSLSLFAALIVGFQSLLLAQSPSPAVSPNIAVAPAASPQIHVDASSPAPKNDKGRFLTMHASFLERAKQGPIDLLFLGDSITERWTSAQDVWKAHYEKYNPANFGISGDATQHILWRIQNGELDNIHPKVLVLMIGTNNTKGNSADEIAAADKLIVQKIREKLPDTKILLLAIFPRGPQKAHNGTVDDGVERMQKIHAINAELAKMDNGNTIRFLDIGNQFLDANGKIPADVMPDQLHPSPKGYDIWAAAMQPLLDQMMASQSKQ